MVRSLNHALTKRVSLILTILFLTYQSNGQMKDSARSDVSETKILKGNLGPSLIILPEESSLLLQNYIVVVNGFEITDTVTLNLFLKNLVGIVKKRKVYSAKKAKEKWAITATKSVLYFTLKDNSVINFATMQKL